MIWKPLLACSLLVHGFNAQLDKQVPLTRSTPTVQAVLSVTASLSAPSSARTLARSLNSISIESDRWPEWTGVNSRNSFLYNVLKNLGSITERMPDIRVGGNTEDHTTFDDSVNVVRSTFPPASKITPYPEATSVRLSSQFYKLSKWLPSGTHMTYGVNLGTGSITNALDTAKAIVAAFASGSDNSKAGIVLDTIEIGNEPDLYANNKARPSNYTVAQYYSEWSKFAQSLISGIPLKPNTSPKILVASFAGSDHGAGKFSPQKLFTFGIDKTFGSHIDTVSQHHYSDSFCTGSAGFLSDLMNKRNVRGNISQYDPDIEATTSRDLTYVLGETNSVSCHGAPGVSNTAGAAIWALDYSLQAATHNIRRLYWHDGIGFKYNLIQPVQLNRSTIDGHTLNPPLKPHVQPQYYAAIVGNTFIGSSKSNTISTRISELSIPSSNVAGYAAYDNGRLKRIVLINSLAYFKSAKAPRGSTTLKFSFSGSEAPQTMQVRRLSIQHADDGSGVRFAGRTYETANGLPEGKDTFTTVGATSDVVLSDTEAVLITLL